MNYRHVFHAGNFADLLKHAVLAEILRRLTLAGPPLTIIDTHAGAGLYDLESAEARRTGEGEAARRLAGAFHAPAIFQPLSAAVGRVNPTGKSRYYPGSPLLIAEALRPRDRYVACELRADDYAALKSSLVRQLGAEVLKADGWRTALDRTPTTPARLLVLIDPPYERSDDYAKATQSIAAILERNRLAVIAIWLPIKDLDSFDAFASRIDDACAGAPAITIEVRLRPLIDPMRLNGCAMVVINPPAGLSRPAATAAAWIAQTLGEAGSAGWVS